MINVNNVAAADQLHASGRAGFQNISQRAQQLRAQGLDETRIVANLVGELGAAMLPKLNGEDDEQFWNFLWNVCSALASQRREGGLMTRGESPVLLARLATKLHEGR